jgi:hypothetical protein
VLRNVSRREGLGSEALDRCGSQVDWCGSVVSVAMSPRVVDGFNADSVVKRKT